MEYSRFWEFLPYICKQKYDIKMKIVDLRAISFLHYEQLAGTNGMSSIRVVNGMVERILFREFDGGISITVLSLDDTHYGNKK